MKKFKIGDKVRAITNDYGFTTAENHWEGVVTKVRGDGIFDAKTTDYHDPHGIGEEYYDLEMNDFELICANKNVIRIRDSESAYEVAEALMRNGYWVKVTPHGGGYNCDCSVYFKDSEE